MADFKKTEEISSGDLAYMGDSVIETLVREYLVRKGCPKGQHLSELSLAYVTATAQSDAYERVLSHLTEEESEVLRRGRNNYHTGNVPKSATPAQYRRATALEALFGYLYLKNENERMRNLFDIAYGFNNKQD